MVGLLGAEADQFLRPAGDYYKRNPALVTSLLQAETFKKVWANAQSTDRPARRERAPLRIHLGEPQPLVVSTNQPTMTSQPKPLKWHPEPPNH